jgi:hypothetical protein
MGDVAARRFSYPAVVSLTIHIHARHNLERKWYERTMSGEFDLFLLNTFGVPSPVIRTTIMVMGGCAHKIAADEVHVGRGSGEFTWGSFARIMGK